MKIIFRVDSSLRIGTGHVMRCLALAEKLREEHHSIEFICRDLPGNLIPLIKEKNHSVRILPFNVKSEKQLQDLPEQRQWLGTTWEDDLYQTMKVISKADW